MTSRGLAGFHDAAVEPIAAHFTGYRAWRLVDIVHAPSEPWRALPMFIGPLAQQPNGSLLGLTHSTFRWGDGVNTASCDVNVPLWVSMGTSAPTPQAREARDKHNAAHQHGSPAQECGCGFWAYSSRGSLGAKPVVMGVIHAWGRVIVGPLGFRAQHARIVALHVAPLNADNDGSALQRRTANVRAGYPHAALYDDPDLMFDVYPATDLRPFLPDTDDDDHDDN